MHNGLTPYDKKVYKESKLRRKQAKRAEYTGRIKPIRKSKMHLIMVVFAITFVAVTVSVVVFVVSAFNKSGADNISVQTDDSELLLAVVNKISPLDDDFVPEVITCGNVKVNVIVYEQLSAMLEDASKSGVRLTVKRGYTSYSEQEQLYNAKFDELMNTGDYTNVRAQAQTQKLVARAGESEFQLGMLVEFDVSDSAAASYLERNCLKFGFILRYPKDKEDITGMNYNDSVYRYVGTENAVSMRTLNMCPEEYNDYISEQKNN